MNYHQKQWQFLVKSAELGRLPHALLFFGQEHLGKKKLAVDFAKLFLGKDIEKGTNPDFILVEPEGPAFAKASAVGSTKSASGQTKSAGKKEIQIAQIRNLIEKLSFKPYLANFKIAVINNAHLMTQEAQNCFLKFLEEPKAQTFLILVTAYPLLLLPTILSRVQKIRFFPEKNFELKTKEEFIADLIKISKADFSTRFQYAKDVSPDNLGEILDDWLSYLRKILISRLSKEKPKELSSYSLAKLKDILNQIQLTRTLISTTNVNSRLALEILLLKI